MYYHGGQVARAGFPKCRRLIEIITSRPPSTPHLEIFIVLSCAPSGDTAIAKAMFERYLAGELSEELLTISRQCVEEDRVDRLSKASGGGSDTFSGVS